MNMPSNVPRYNLLYPRIIPAGNHSRVDKSVPWLVLSSQQFTFPFLMPSSHQIPPGELCRMVISPCVGCAYTQNFRSHGVICSHFHYRDFCILFDLNKGAEPDMILRCLRCRGFKGYQALRSPVPLWLFAIAPVMARKGMVNVPCIFASAWRFQAIISGLSFHIKIGGSSDTQ